MPVVFPGITAVLSWVADGNVEEFVGFCAGARGVGERGTDCGTVPTGSVAIGTSCGGEVLVAGVGGLCLCTSNCCVDFPCVESGVGVGVGVGTATFTVFTFLLPVLPLTGVIAVGARRPP